MSAFNFSAHERMLMSGERKIILFNLYDQILLQAYFGPLNGILTLFMTFNNYFWPQVSIFDPFNPTSVYLRPFSGHFFRFLAF
jgi:hypothetical protein